MSTFGDPNKLDVFGNQPHDVFGTHYPTDVFFNSPMDVWGSPLGAIDDRLRHNEHPLPGVARPSI